MCTSTLCYKTDTSGLRVQVWNCQFEHWRCGHTQAKTAGRRTSDKSESRGLKLMLLWSFKPTLTEISNTVGKLPNISQNINETETLNREIQHVLNYSTFTNIISKLYILKEYHLEAFFLYFIIVTSCCMFLIVVTGAWHLMDRVPHKRFKSCCLLAHFSLASS